MNETKNYKSDIYTINPESMEKYEGEYVVIYNDEVVEHNKDFSKILKLAEKYPKDDAIITRIFSQKENLF